MGCGASRDRDGPAARTKPYDPDNESDTDFSDAGEFAKLEKKIAAQPEAPPPTPEELSDLHRRWWGLGNERWKECIDGAKWSYGRFCFDLCLHGLNGGRKEVGYLSSMYDSWCVAERYLGQRVTPDMWLEVQAAAMSHPGNDFLVGKFRHLGQGNRALVSMFFNGFPQGMNQQAFKEFNKMPRKLCYVKKSDHPDYRYKYERCMPGIKRRRMRHYLQKFINELYVDLAKCTRGDAQQIVPPLCTFMQRVCRMEPCRDGNTRTLVVMINKIATDWGLHPMLFEWPDAAGTVSYAEWKQTMFDALAAWEKDVAALPAEAGTGTKPPRENFVPPEAAEAWVAEQKNAFFTD